MFVDPALVVCEDLQSLVVLLHTVHFVVLPEEVGLCQTLHVHTVQCVTTAPDVPYPT